MSGWPKWWPTSGITWPPCPNRRRSERKAVLNLVASRLRSAPLTTGIEAQLKALEELELRATGSWAIVATAQTDWVTTAIQYLEAARGQLPAGERPDPYWADDVVAGVIASVRALIGVDELHARTESHIPGRPRKDPPADA